MSAVDESYIAVLEGIQNGKPVTYGDPKIIAASATIDEAKTEALRWATDLHKHVGKKATLSLKRGHEGAA